MSHIRSEKTKPEQIVAAYLRKNHMGYRRYSKSLPGKPDFVLTKYHSVIFVNGCFWHRHAGCKRATTPKSNQEYWNAKFQRNIERDKKEYELLNALGWRVFIVWECQLGKDAESHLQKLVNDIISDGQHTFSEDLQYALQ